MGGKGSFFFFFSFFWRVAVAEKSGCRPKIGMSHKSYKPRSPNAHGLAKDSKKSHRKISPHHVSGEGI